MVPETGCSSGRSVSRDLAERSAAAALVRAERANKCLRGDLLLRGEAMALGVGALPASKASLIGANETVSSGPL